MQYFEVLGHDFRFLYLSGTSEGVGPIEQFYGTHPWDWMDTPDAEEELREHYYKAKEQGHHRYGVLWACPGKESVKRFYYVHLKWLGLTDVALVGHVYEFPISVAELTPNERQAVLALGRFGNVATAASHLGKSQSTLRSQLASARDRIGLDVVAENDAIEVFANRLYLAVKGAVPADLPYEIFG